MTPLPAIIFSENAFAEIRDYLSLNLRGAVFTDATLAKIYETELVALIAKGNVQAFPFPANETSKSLKTIDQLAGQLQQNGYDRKNTRIIALGGGIVGDIIGFLASIYLRGVPYLQVPTTLLAMVDSSIGGKTGVNTQYGKNMLGSFYHPEKIIIDLNFLQKLPELEIRNGLAEMIKHAVLDSREHLEELEENIPEILMKNKQITEQMIKKSIQVKLRHVEADEREREGIRSFLNFGHTFGHAIEKASYYAIPHGQAISIGMMLESEIAEKELGFQGKSLIQKVFEQAGLPTTLPKTLSMKDLWGIMRSDKKNEYQKIGFALPQDFGKFTVFQKELQT